MTVRVAENGPSFTFLVAVNVPLAATFMLGTASMNVAARADSAAGLASAVASVGHSPAQAGRSSMRQTFAGGFVLVLVGLVLTGGAGARLRTAFPETRVTFSFHSQQTWDARSYTISGSGSMSFFEPLKEGLLARAHAGYARSTVTIRREARSATFAILRSGYEYVYSYSGKSEFDQTVRLTGHVTDSTLPELPAGTAGRIFIHDEPSVSAAKHVSGRIGEVYLNGRHERTAATITIKPKPSPLPSQLILTVNREYGIATSKEPSDHRTISPVAPKSSLDIEATLDHPLPPGWTFRVWHNGDPESKGNGDYYSLCEISGSATNMKAPSCEGSRPTSVGSGNDDFVNAAVGAPTYTALYVQIDIPVK